jgi:hypothetical protein
MKQNFIEEVYSLLFHVKKSFSSDITFLFGGCKDEFSYADIVGVSFFKPCLFP